MTPLTSASNQQSQPSFDWLSFARQRTIAPQFSTRSLVVTFFGDIATVHGQWIWLGSVIESLALFGISERLVRTSVFRLVKDDWLQSKKIGRRSYYAFTDNAQKVYLQAAKRIYQRHMPQTNDEWTLLLPLKIDDESLSYELKKQLRWLGFNRLSSGIWGHPSLQTGADADSLLQLIEQIGVSDKVIVFKATALGKHSFQVLSEQLEDQWALPELAAAYQEFIDLYQTILQRLKSDEAEMTPQNALLLRLLLIHDYRRILLKDFDLPLSMLPVDWPGATARQIVAAIYQLLMKQSAVFIEQKFQSPTGAVVVAADNSFCQRFK